MRISISGFERQTALLLVMMLVTSLGEAATPPQQPVPESPEPGVSQSRLQAASKRTSETVAAAGQSAATLPNDPGVAGAQGADQKEQPGASTNSSENQTSPTPAPVGTAAAPYVKPDGVPGSNPAGAAIAPAKQRHLHSLAIKVGLVVGAGIAIGVVAAASMGSQSRPH